MKFTEQVVVALMLAVLGASLTALGTLVGAALAKPIIAVLTSAYLVYLMWRSRVRVGRVVTGAAYVLGTLAAGLFAGLGWFVLYQALAIWLVRSLYFHNGPLACIADLALVAIGLGAGVWAFGTGSVFLALWSLFLIQGLFVWLPELKARAAADARDFNGAKLAAESALQNLLARN